MSHYEKCPNHHYRFHCLLKSVKESIETDSDSIKFKLDHHMYRWKRWGTPEVEILGEATPEAMEGVETIKVFMAWYIKHEEKVDRPESDLAKGYNRTLNPRNGKPK